MSQENDSKRYSRQKDIVPIDRIAACKATVTEETQSLKCKSENCGVP